MTGFLCLLYCVLNGATWRRSEYERTTYLARAAVSALFGVYLVAAGDVERLAIGLVAEFLVVLELIMFAFAVDARDPRVYGEQE